MTPAGSDPPPPRRLSGLWRRALLTHRHLGPRETARRVISYPLRFTPLRDRLHLNDWTAAEVREAQRWYRRHGRPVTIVIPTYGDTAHVREAVAAIRRTVPRRAVSVIICDDASPPEHRASLRALAGSGVQVIEGERNVGFAANANRGLRAAATDRDVVLLNSDVRPHAGWLQALQRAAHAHRPRQAGTTRVARVGIVGARLLYPDGRLQFGGTHRNLGAPEWFDHRFRFKPARHGPANLAMPVLAVTGACMYVRRDLLDAIGPLDEDYAMAYEDVDWCLRAWEAGYAVVYEPAATLTHLESVTRGTDVGERERSSQEHFWRRWGPHFAPRNVRTTEGGLRVAYVTQDTGVGGGHRDVYEHLNRLADRGHDATLYTLGPQPDWFDLRVPVHSFETFEALRDALAALEAIKVATWWTTASAVWQASLLKGRAVYFVQDIETSYYPGNERVSSRVLASYQQEFRYMTISGWNRDRLRELGLEADLIPPGIDLGLFRPLGVQRREDVMLAVGRSNPLKNLPLTLAAFRSLGEPRPELRLFGIEPDLAQDPGVSYESAPSDERVNELYNEATVFVQTSSHEGFCLPALEAMATGAAVVCTDAHGNRDYCRDGVNCLMPEATVESVAGAIGRLLSDPALRGRLGTEGQRTAAEYSWDRRIDELEQFLESVAASEA